MNSILRRKPVLVRVAFGMVVGVLAVVCSNGQAYSQSSTRSNSGKWTKLVAPAVPVAPAIPTSSTVEDSPVLVNPLKDLRQPDPSGLLEQDFPVERVFGNTNYSSRQNRSEAILPVGWSQPGLRHRQLYFQDDQIERGNEKRQFPNVAAGAKFFKSLFVFPIRLTTGN